MSSPRKAFLFGLGAGTALTLLLLQVWGDYLERSNTEYAYPRILRPFRHAYPQPSLQAFENLPHPWVPQTLNNEDVTWQLTPIGGAPVTLSQFRGKVLFLNFWATSCGPCTKEMPGISRLYHSLKNERIAFVAVTGERRPEVSKFLEQNDIRVPVYLTDQGPPKGLPVPGVPTTFILDGHGDVILMHSGALNWDETKLGRISSISPRGLADRRGRETGQVLPAPTPVAGGLGSGFLAPGSLISVSSSLVSDY